MPGKIVACVWRRNYPSSLVILPSPHGHTHAPAFALLGSDLMQDKHDKCYRMVFYLKINELMVHVGLRSFVIIIYTRKEKNCFLIHLAGCLLLMQMNLAVQQWCGSVNSFFLFVFRAPVFGVCLQILMVRFVYSAAKYGHIQKKFCCFSIVREATPFFLYLISIISVLFY